MANNIEAGPALEALVRTLDLIAVELEFADVERVADAFRQEGDDQDMAGRILRQLADALLERAVGHAADRFLEEN